MKNIIVPTDFSEIATNAFEYANDLAEYLDSSLKLVNVVHPAVQGGDNIVIPSMDELVSKAEEQMNEFVEERYVSNDPIAVIKAKISEEVIVGFAVDELVKISEKDEVDLLLMGTTGAGTVLGKLFGSVSSAVAQKAKCPVLLVPPQVKFNGYKKILYASNYESADKNMLMQVKTLAEQFNADIDLVHVNTSDKDEDFNFEDLLVKQLFLQLAEDNSINFQTIHEDSVWKGLNEYANENKVDLIVLLTKKRNFWNNLFHKSLTKDLVMHAQVPIMVYHSY